ncbi:MAG: DUF4295 domain-containing protein [Cytophagaceae bacterium]|jgi:hypothetical protein|nr:DUF4295 domain-containing protein [Cytophagaceae bacterium]
MAKKTVASLQKGGGKGHTRVIKMVKSEKTGAYTFRSEMVTNETTKDFFDKK